MNQLRQLTRVAAVLAMVCLMLVLDGALTQAGLGQDVRLPALEEGHDFSRPGIQVEFLNEVKFQAFANDDSGMAFPGSGLFYSRNGLRLSLSRGTILQESVDGSMAFPLSITTLLLEAHRNGLEPIRGGFLDRSGGRSWQVESNGVLVRYKDFQIALHLPSGAKIRMTEGETADFFDSLARETEYPTLARIGDRSLTD